MATASPNRIQRLANMMGRASRRQRSQIRRRDLLERKRRRIRLLLDSCRQFLQQPIRQNHPRLETRSLLRRLTVTLRKLNHNRKQNLMQQWKKRKLRWQKKCSFKRLLPRNHQLHRPSNRRTFGQLCQAAKRPHSDALLCSRSLHPGSSATSQVLLRSNSHQQGNNSLWHLKRPTDQLQDHGRRKHRSKLNQQGNSSSHRVDKNSRFHLRIGDNSKCHHQPSRLRLCLSVLNLGNHRHHRPLPQGEHGVKTHHHRHQEIGASILLL